MAVGVKFRFLHIRVGRVKYQLEPGPKWRAASLERERVGGACGCRQYTISFATRHYLNYQNIIAVSATGEWAER
jgi:hypothetical protein